MWPKHLQSLKLLHPMVKEMYLQEKWQTHARTHGQTTDQLWYNIIIPFLSKEKKMGIKMQEAKWKCRWSNGQGFLAGKWLYNFVRIWHLIPSLENIAIFSMFSS